MTKLSAKPIRSKEAAAANKKSKCLDKSCNDDNEKKKLKQKNKKLTKATEQFKQLPLSYGIRHFRNNQYDILMTNENFRHFCNNQTSRWLMKQKHLRTRKPITRVKQWFFKNMVSLLNYYALLFFTVLCQAYPLVTQNCKEKVY